MFLQVVSVPLSQYTKKRSFFKQGYPAIAGFLHTVNIHGPYTWASGLGLGAYWRCQYIINGVKIMVGSNQTMGDLLGTLFTKSAVVAEM